MKSVSKSVRTDAPGSLLCSAPLDAEQLRASTGALLGGGIGIFEVNPLLALDINVEVLVVVFAVTSVFDKMNVHRAVIQRTLNLLASQLVTSVSHYGVGIRT